MRDTAKSGLRPLTTTVLLLGFVFAAGCEGNNLFEEGRGPAADDPSADTRVPEVFIPPTDEALLEWNACVEGVIDEDTGETVRLCSVGDLTVTDEEGTPFPPVEEGSGVSVGDSILVAVEVSDNTGITEVKFEGLAFRGDPNVGTDVVVPRFSSKTVEFEEPVRDTILRRFLLPTGEEVREVVDIIVSATDVNGNVGTDTIQINVGGPTVFFVDLADQVVVGQRFEADVHVQDEEAVTRVVLEVTGDFETTVVETLDPAPRVDTVSLGFTVPEGTTGQITIQAIARNRAGLEAQTREVTLDLVTESDTDEVPPELLVTMEAGEILELSDVVSIKVTGQDDPQGRGVQAIGYTLVSNNISDGTSLVLTGSVNVDPSIRSTRSHTFEVAVGDLNVDEVGLPDTLTLRVVGWMEDNADPPNPACSDGTDGDFESLPCSDVAFPTGDVERWIVDEAGDPVTGLELTERVVVAGRTIVLPNEEARIADAVVDERRESVVLSNQTDDRLEIFDLQTFTFGDAILVGSDPWGLFFDRAGDHDVLFVGNSGGTNISRVDMNAEAELVSQRILTPNSLLWEVGWNVVDGILNQEVSFFDFSDRPQFIAQDANGNLVYSTVPTGSAPDGTIRLADLSTPVVEVVIYVEHGELTDAENTSVVWRVDDVVEGASCVTVTDRVYGTDDSRSETRCIEFAPDFAILDDDGLQSQGSDAQVASPKAWDIGSVGLSDTTFISSSGDGSRIAIGEGATGPTGRILIYDAATQSVSAAKEVLDLVGNASERVFGVDMNFDGSMGVARGQLAVYFFTPDLRLQGSPGVEPGGAGAVLHPLHSDGPLDTDVNTAFAFVGTGENTIDIYDTRHFSRIGQVTIRDNIAGPLRAVMPFSGDNDGLTCAMTSVTDDGTTIGQTVAVFGDASGNTLNAGTDDECIVAKLVGITDAGGVVVVDVRVADATRFHPAR